MERPKEWPLLAVSVPPVRFRPPDLPTLGRFSVPPPGLRPYWHLGRSAGPGKSGRAAQVFAVYLPPVQNAISLA